MAKFDDDGGGDWNTISTKANQVSKGDVQDEPGEWTNLPEVEHDFQKFNVNDNEPDSEHGKGGGGCHNCGQDGHIARECPEPKKLTGECFNCGEVGHNKADCPNPRVERPFTGECRICQKTGHMAKDCPDKGPEICKNCGVEGEHKTSECTANRKLDRSNVPDMSPEEAFSKLKEVGQGRDLDDFNEALDIFCKARPEFDYIRIEKLLRATESKFYIIALDRPIPASMVLVDRQGVDKKKYTVAFFTDSKPQRVHFQEMWPESPEQNMERLKDAGEPMPSVLPYCRRCGESGHTTRTCSQERIERGDGKIICPNCSEEGHRLKECTQPIVSQEPGLCRNCEQPGHKASECTEPLSAANVECKNCGETGHFARDCPNKVARTCRNCGSAEHLARDCDQPRNMDLVLCRNCDKAGHVSRDCPEPKDWSRVKCSNCGEMGHTRVRCKQPVAEVEADTGGFGSGGFTGDSGSVEPSGSWNKAGAGGSVQVTGDWDS